MIEPLHDGLNIGLVDEGFLIVILGVLHFRNLINVLPQTGQFLEEDIQSLLLYLDEVLRSLRYLLQLLVLGQNVVVELVQFLDCLGQHLHVFLALLVLLGGSFFLDVVL